MDSKNYAEKIESILIQDRVNSFKKRMMGDKYNFIGPPLPPKEEYYLYKKDSMGRMVAYRNPAYTAHLKERWIKMVVDAGLNPRLPKEENLDNWETDILEQLSQGGKNAILHGEAGRGKTTLALMASKALVKRERTFLVIRSPDEMARFLPKSLDVEDTSSGELLDRLVKPLYLLMDEVGYCKENKEISSYMQEIMMNIVSKREALGRFTWWTTNKDIAWLEREYDTPIMSRMNRTGECVTVDFNNRPNYREIKKQ